MRKLSRLLLCLLLWPMAIVAQGVHYSYDELRRLVGVVDAGGNAAAYSYDANGNITAINRYNANQVAVLGFLPESGQPGTLVTITGSNFGSDPKQITVLLSGSSATVQSASTNVIVALVPAGATNGPISVTSPIGTGTSGRSFRVDPPGSGPPSITSINPPIASVNSTVIISGSNFSLRALLDEGSINSSRVQIANVASSSSLSISLPAIIGSGHVKLLTPFGMATSNADLYVPPTPFTSSQVSVTQRISSGIPTQVSLAGSGNIGMLLIDGNAHQQLSVVLSNSTFGGCVGLLTTVYNPDGSQLGSLPQCGNAAGLLGPFTLPSTGTYTVVLSGPSGSTGSVQVNAFLFSNLAGTLSSGTPTTVTINSPGQVETLSLSGVAGQQLSLALNNATFGGCVGLVTTIYNPDGSQLGTLPQCGNPSGLLGPFTLPSTGTYTVVLSGPSGSTGSVQVSAFLFSNLAGTLSPGTATSVTINTPGQTETLSLSGVAGQQLSLTLNNSTFNGWPALSATVFNPDGSQLGSGSLASWNSYAFLGPFTLPSTGTYTVVLSDSGGGTGSVQISVQEQ